MAARTDFFDALPMAGEYDVLVAGAGPSGLCAAVAAARAGASVALIERYGVMGGNLTVGHVGPILGTVGPGTMRDELMAALGVADNDMIGATGKVHDAQRAKRVVTDFVASQRGIAVYLQTAIAGALMEDNRVSGLAVAGHEGLRAIRGRVTVDATGVGDVAAFAGARYEKGRLSDGLMQPVTLEFTVGGVDEAVAIACIGDVDQVELHGERFLDYTARCAQMGWLPRNLAAVRLHRTTVPGERRVNTTQENGIDPTRTGDIFRAEVVLRRQIDQVVSFLRDHVPGYENCRVIDSAQTLGVRESRRVVGLYTLTREDLVSGRKFADAVVHDADFIVDIHNPQGPGQAEDTIQYVKPFDIPYRCFVPERIDGVLVTGRAISGTHEAHAAYRVMSVCMAMGQAAGVAAALCAREGIQPRNLDVGALRGALARQGVKLFDAKREEEEP